ncbi:MULTISPECIES: glycoside hydrolase family 2 TIM barrel-domain containing protein [Chryseobacterium]|uniref:glycoside hydrolase family 2 TIM barrel-domain containing protein n=1 Tax=Chryseobacterium TaxID=59732 RepID=UPI001BE6DE3F|nr:MULTISPECIES: glycoside hydrolase family 2 TIM barrel-domain containing protein [Chryseobacterium]MBT2619847.1 beta galactosidase jelly roll domain-containing protein [Chryseobacterium sp. ISL-6]
MNQLKNIIIPALLLLPVLLFSQRIKQSMNTSWQFHKGTGGSESDKDYWKDINIPHTWNAEDVMDDEAGYYRGIGWYQKEIYIPQGWKEKSIYLYFEGASQVAEVFVNGISVGTHLGGYLAFSFNITKALHEGKNEIKVKLDNSHNSDIPPLGGDFSVYGGIYRDVYLIAVDKNHFDMDNYATNGVFISTPSVNEESAVIQIKGKIISDKKIRIKTSVYDKEGRKIAFSESKPDKNGNFTTQIKNIKKPDLWSPEDPNLYKVVSELADESNNVVYDEVVNPLGFRWYHFNVEKGFYLNGKPYKIMGASRHQDFKGMGSALTDALHINDVQWLKDMGGNFLRVSHYPQDPAIMEACDRLGILTAVETPGNNQITESENYTRNMLDMQREMIRQNYNHPSVIMWSYMNEALIQPLYKDKTPEREKYWGNLYELAQKMEALCRAEDGERYTMIAFHGDFDIYKRIGLIDIPKIAGWNLYQGWYGGKFEDFETFVLKHHKEYPLRPLIISEFGADSDYRLHNFKPTIFDKTQEYANLYHEAYIRTIKKYPFIAGAIVWNLAEFGNESRQEAVPHINNKGLLTTDRKPKDSYFIYKALLAKEPFVKIGGSDWLYRAQQADQGSDTYATQPVTVYTNQKEVKLWLNGQLIGAESMNEGKAVFTCIFKNGNNTLKAITNDGQEDFVNIDFHVIANQLKSKENSFSTLNVSMGDQRMFEDDLTKEAWVPEKEYEAGSWGYIGGKIYKEDEKGERYGSRRNIFGTSYDAMYETQRIGLKTFKADVPDGFYELTLHFAELLSAEQQEKLVYNLENNANQNTKTGIGRRFDVAVNGLTILEDLSDDNYLKPITAYNTKITLLVKEGQGITINFIPKQGEPILNGLQIRKLY